MTTHRSNLPAAFRPHSSIQPLLAAALFVVLTLAACPGARAQLAAPIEPGPETGSTAGVQKLPEFYVKDAANNPFEGGANLDLPRSSNDVQPYTIIDREAIDESNAVNLSDFMQQQLTQNTTGLQFDQEAGGPSINTRGLSQVNLNGLGTLQTLILINGHRTSGVVDEGTIFQSNINQIPLSAVDHVEWSRASSLAPNKSSKPGSMS